MHTHGDVWHGGAFLVPHLVHEVPPEVGCQLDAHFFELSAHASCTFNGVYPRIDSNLFAFGQVGGEPRANVWRTWESSPYECPAAGQFSFGLEEVPPVGPERRIFLGDDSRSCRSSKSADEGTSGHAIRCVFAHVGVFGRHHVCVDFGFVHGRPQRFQLGLRIHGCGCCDRSSRSTRFRDTCVWRSEVQSHTCGHRLRPYVHVVRLRSSFPFSCVRPGSIRGIPRFDPSVERERSRWNPILSFERGRVDEVDCTYETKPRDGRRKIKDKCVGSDTCFNA
mmetsp:Transcript_565/g.3987  ORF Transcript_565/g.3987 Transcript_565/m.3987 type:complete len:279 (+) Transcript_565:2330-3166(+)